MPAQIIDGTVIAQQVRMELKARIEGLKERGVLPGLAVVLVGDDPASISYVTGKERASTEIGIFSQVHRLPGTAARQEVLSLIDRLNSDARIHGILVQIPLPPHLDETEVVNAISPAKDVDGLHPVNMGRLMAGLDTFLPCTPHGVVVLLQRSGVRTAGAHAVIVGRSNLVGKPLANLLMQKREGGNATVTVCHTGTRDIGSFTRQADILIAAMGRPRTITADMVKAGAVVIDVGVSRVDDSTAKRGYRLVGDVDFEAVLQKAAMITPVPRGVGPMTITMLLANTVKAASRQ